LPIEGACREGTQRFDQGFKQTALDIPYELDRTVLALAAQLGATRVRPIAAALDTEPGGKHFEAGPKRGAVVLGAFDGDDGVARDGQKRIDRDHGADLGR
jgi:hypothetical protein